MRGALPAATLALAVVFAPGRATAAAPKGFAGHWRWSLQASCVANKSNPRACIELISMGLHIYAIHATRMTYTGSDSLTVDARGRFTESGSATFSGQSPGAPKLKECNPSVMESKFFQKTCHVTWKGRGHIAKGGTYLPDFYSDSGKLTYPNPRTDYFENYRGIGDSLIPAVPGDYSSTRYLSLVAYAKYLPGVHVHLKVERSR